MTLNYAKLVLTAAALLFSASATLSAQTKPAPAPAAVGEDGERILPKKKVARTPRPKMVVPKIKQVNINGASKEELMKLPGITAAYADAIVKGRPYNSKARLLSNKILPEGVWQGVRSRIVAVQPPQK